ncbi:hypothetical protein NKW53_07880 [Acetobacter orientalis]|uniref:hypothetical protein n=1 Tax=Acetobacter orientalis TaxID=146474 RepID=UPI00209E19EB|nr:hypothetical protein [Acetobacter orientalis]MCP1215979.1 hypothetical protein [Acetobacter orientalis]MCP1217861.1 hypothetical protein [Acetobacter orientalis]
MVRQSSIIWVWMRKKKITPLALINRVAFFFKKEMCLYFTAHRALSNTIYVKRKTTAQIYIYFFIHNIPFLYNNKNTTTHLGAKIYAACYFSLLKILQQDIHLDIV